MDRGTIAALSTPSGRGGIAVIRISGDLAQGILREIIEKVPEKIVKRKAVHSFIIDSGKRIEECVYTYFALPDSYTGEDVIEISIHSNPFLTETILNLIFSKGARNALPGEFTFRAFKNKKIDLIQAESINELINANSKYFAEMKFGNLEGKLSLFLKGLKELLISLAVKIETTIEFQEENSIKEIDFIPELEAAKKKIDKIISGYRFNEVLDQGLKLVIVGKTNTGKSSLFNLLLLEDRSITSPIPGTTRDFIRERIFLKGFPVELFDVAGINSESADDIEKLGISRSIELVANSDAVIFLLDGSSDFDENDRSIYRLIKDKKRAVFINKSDKLKSGIQAEIKNAFSSEQISTLSVLKNTGIENVYDFIYSVIDDIGENKTEISVNLRQKDLLAGISNSLNNANKMMKTNRTDIELIAEEIRLSIKKIGKLLGEVKDEDIINKIFSNFCIGK